MGEKEFEELIRRYQLGQATDRERALIEKWLEQRNAKDPFSKLSGGERQKIGIHIFKNLSGKILEGDVDLRSAKPAQRKFAFYQVAAALVIVALFSYTISRPPSSSVEEKITMIHSTTSTHGIKKVILSDSTIVWLKGNSSIVYPEKFDSNERNITLTGEALFEVSKNPHQPFTIECDGVFTRVLGTSFNIRASEGDVEVIVLTGKVSLSIRNGNPPLIVLPNEKAVYHKDDNKIEKIVAEVTEVTEKTVETDYCMRFKAAPMKEIIRKIEKKFDVRVALSDKALGNCTITADFTDQSLERTLSMIAQTLKIEYEITSSQVVLRGKGCA